MIKPGGGRGNDAHTQSRTPSRTPRGGCRDRGQKILSENGQQVPVASQLSTEEIRTRRQQALVEYAEPVDMPVAYACDGVESMVDPDCR
jgi:hypothetical protein